ncbi:MAG: negative regulator of flagellin synthesis FlgM [Lentisphaeria bacterium]|jgi:negative regulator of flagellin synthesis FlgM
MVIEPGNSINLHGSSTGKARSTAPEKPADAKSITAEVAHSASDSVSLSAAGQSIAKAEASLSSSSEIDQGKVNQVRAAIASGSYQIDIDAIADKVIAQEELLG